MECYAKIMIRSEFAKTVLSAIEPDNVNLPQDMEIDCNASEDSLYCSVRILCKEVKDVLRLRNTIDDILSSIKLSLSSISSAGKSL